LENNFLKEILTFGSFLDSKKKPTVKKKTFFKWYILKTILRKAIIFFNGAI